MSATCDSCGADIVWVVSKNEKPMPLDLPPEKRITIDVMNDGVEVGNVRDTYISHFATCPNAAHHRRKT